jgi:hypothetical protein
MALKDFDFKQFMLDKGERVALAAAGFFMALLVIFGLIINGLGSGSASANADELTKLKDSGKSAFDQSRPPGDLVNVDPDLLRAGKLVRLDPIEFLAMNPFFIAMQTEDTKWRKPKVLAPDEFQADYVRGLVRAYWITADNKKVVFVQPKDKSAKQKTVAAPQPKNRRGVPGGNQTQAQSPFASYGGLRGLGGMGGKGGMPGGGMGPMGGMPGGGMGGKGGMPGGGMGPMGGMPGGGDDERGGGGLPSGFMAMGGNMEKPELEFIYVPIERLAKSDGWPAGGWPAEQAVPQRMAVIQAAFPYKEQMEEFRKALRYPYLSMMEQEAAAEFSGLNVQRRAVSPDGKPIEDWKPVDIINSVRPLLIFGWEPEDEKLLQYGIVWPRDRLTVPRPMLNLTAKYPEVIKLEGIKNTIEEFDRLAKDAIPVYQAPPTKFDPSLDIYDFEPNPGTGNRVTGGVGPMGMGTSMPGMDPEGRSGAGAGYGAAGSRMKSGIPGKMTMGGQGMGMTMGAQGTGSMPGGPGAMGAFGQGGFQSMGSQVQDRLIPDKCLVRFLDVTIEPGHTYEYRIQVKMANPLYKRLDKAIDESSTTEKELLGPWATVSQPLAVSDDTEVFVVVDEKTRGRRPDSVPVQIHRWFDYIELNKSKLAQVPVGDWEIAEYVDAKRGEYIGRVEDEEVAMWNPQQEAFVFAVPADKKRPVRQRKGIPVDFGTRYILVDFQGGRQEEAARKDAAKIRDESPLEVLVLSPDGKLLVRNSRDDTDNPDRKDRLDTWQHWIKDVRDGSLRTQMPASQMMMPGGGGGPGQPPGSGE